MESIMEVGFMNKEVKKVICFALTVALVAGFLPANDTVAAKKAAIKTKKLLLDEGKSKKVKIKNKKKGCTYIFKSSKPKIAKVNKKGKVTGLKAGTAKITVKEKAMGKKAKKAKSKKIGVCRVTVKGVENAENKSTVLPIPPTGTGAPKATEQIIPTDAPATASPWALEIKPTIVPAYYTSSYTLGDSNELALGNLMQYGGICKVSVECNKGSGKNVTVSYFGEYLYFECNGAYINDSTMKKMPLEEGSETKECSSDEQVLEFTFEIPKYTDDFNLRFDADGVDIKNITIETNPVEGADYPEMVANSYRYTADNEIIPGNNARIKKAIEKARKGENVTLAYLGGSITEGFAASETKNSDCYAETSYNEFKYTYALGDGSNVHFINAGMSGTSSRLGIIRYQRDVIEHMEYSGVPDILFIDFAVNDGNDADTYESIIRTALSQGSAVVLMFVLYTGGCAHEDEYSKIGEYYGLEMVSPGNGQKAAAPDKTAFDNWFYWNDGHPDVGGHRYMADCIMNMFYRIDAEDTDEDNITDIADITPMKATGDAFTGMKTLEKDVNLNERPSVHSLDCGSFSETDNAQPVLQYIKDGVEGLTWFPKAWAHTASSGNESFKAEIECNSIIVAYKKAGSGFGIAECYLDGNKVGELNGTAQGAWNYAEMNTVLSGNEVGTHTLEIKMKDGDETKPFTIYAIGYANKNE